MKSHLRRIAVALFAFPLSLAATAPASKPDVRLWRLDCGSLFTLNLDELSDTRAYVGQSKKFVGSCYLIRHGDAYLLWDTGLSKTALNKPLTQETDSESLTTTIVDQLASIGVKPAQISLIGISHYHFDHIGQAADFPQAKLLIGQGDFDVLSRFEAPIRGLAAIARALCRENRSMVLEAAARLLARSAPMRR